MNREQQVGATPGKAPPGSEKNREERNGKDIGPIGVTARIVVGLGLVGSVIHGQLSVHLAPASLRTRPLLFQNTSRTQEGLFFEAPRSVEALVGKCVLMFQRGPGSLLICSMKPLDSDTDVIVYT